MGAFILFLGLIIIFLATVTVYQVEVIMLLKKKIREQQERGDKHHESFVNKVNENNRLIEKREMLIGQVTDLISKAEVKKRELEMYHQFEELYNKDL